MTLFSLVISGQTYKLTETDSAKIDFIKVENTQKSIPTMDFGFIDTNNEAGNITFGDSVSLSIKGTNVFDGYIERDNPLWRGKKYFKYHCVGKEKDLYRYFPSRSATYSGYTNAIASSMFHDYVKSKIPNYTWKFRPSTNVSNTGTSLTTYYTKGKSIGDCFDEINLMDGYYWRVDGNEVMYYKPSGISKQFTQTDIKIPNLKRDLNDKKTYVKVIGGIGYVNEKLSQTVAEYTDSFSKIQPFRKSSYNYIDRIKFKSYNASGTTTKLAIRPILVNVLGSASISSNGWNNPSNVIDENRSTYSTVDISQNGMSSMKFDLSNFKNLRGIIWKGRFVGGGECFYSVKYRASGGGEWVTYDSGVIPDFRLTWVSRPLHDFVTSSISISFTNKDASTKTLWLYGVYAFERGYNKGKICYWDNPLPNSEIDYTIKKNDDWEDWIVYDTPVNISNYDWIGLSLSENTGNGELYYTDNYDNTVSGQWFSMYSPKKPDDYHLAFEVGWGDEILYEVTGNFSRESERIPYIHKNVDIRDKDTAKKIGDGIINHYNSTKHYGKIEFKEGQENITIDSMISGTIDALGLSGKWNIGKVTHVLDKKTHFKTVVDLSKEPYNVATQIDTMARKNKLGEF